MKLNKSILLTGLVLLTSAASFALPVAQLRLPDVLNTHSEMKRKAPALDWATVSPHFALQKLPAIRLPPPIVKKVDPTNSLKRWKLTGIVSADDFYFATFRQGERMLLLKEGQDLENFELISISPEKVLFRQGTTDYSMSF